MNNLYGKLAASDDSSFKIAYIKDNGSIGFKPIKENKKQPGYIPCGSAITSYARNFTIRAAQKIFMVQTSQVLRMLILTVYTVTICLLKI